VFHSNREYAEEMHANYSPVPEWGKKEEKESQGMRPVPVLWHAMSVKNTILKYIGR
jgi:hypothetical protein